jgi:hypothetical protein
MVSVKVLRDLSGTLKVLNGSFVQLKSIMEDELLEDAIQMLIRALEERKYAHSWCQPARDGFSLGKTL